MLSSLKPANGKFVLGPPVETSAPIVVFTGPANHRDTMARTASSGPKKKKKKVAASPAVKPAAKSEAKPETKSTVPKVSSAAQ